MSVTTYYPVPTKRSLALMGLAIGLAASIVTAGVMYMLIQSGIGRRLESYADNSINKTDAMLNERMQKMVADHTLRAEQLDGVSYRIIRRQRIYEGLARDNVNQHFVFYAQMADGSYGYCRMAIGGLRIRDIGNSDTWYYTELEIDNNGKKCSVCCLEVPSRYMNYVMGKAEKAE